MKETNRIEFKRELNDKFERAVVSFLNYAGGGEILIGMDDNGVAVGVKDVDSVQLKIVDRIRNNIRPQTLGLFDVVPTQINDKDIIRIIVSCGQQRPYYIRKMGMSEQGCFIRVGSSTQPMAEQMIEDLLAKRQQSSLQSMPSPRRNLTFKQLLIYYEEKNFEPTEQFIENLELRQSNGEYNYTAYLLADENGASIKVAVYAGADKVDLLETREYGNRCLITAAQRILDRMDSENRTFAKITAKNRLEKERVNSIALREAVINAIVHNDYAKGVPLVEIFSDRIVVTSCGGLVAGLSEEDLFKCRSMPRNRELMRVFRDIELVEQIGSGMSRILKAYDRSIFELTPNFTIVTFPFAEDFISPNGKINDSADGKINGKINSITDLLKTNPTATIPELADLTGKSQRTISRRLQEYQSLGVLRREGARKNGRWVVR
ncbi:MAG: putative DNA binding domain-containing protein [Candidatus Methanoplasma sp.]|jgi:predicted HTH transcriptional regulator|nr:putative DNA binding domain-containing protein [Candidatus Methanoplasma sp.]